MQGAAALLAASACIYAYLIRKGLCVSFSVSIYHLFVCLYQSICTLCICTYATYVCSLVLVCRYMLLSMFVPPLFLPFEPRHGRALQFLATELRADKEAPGHVFLFLLYRLHYIYFLVYTPLGPTEHGVLGGLLRWGTKTGFSPLQPCPLFCLQLL